jgi:ABC-type polysaccharide/polyol phosphate transport system, ATPase component
VNNDQEPSISVRNISKYFEIYEKPSDRLLQALCRGRKTFYKPFWALSDISFDVQKGECLGIIGRNGAGKSTLLQIITGTLTPSSGSVNIRGRVAALLELGSGFNPEFTGRENVYLNAAVLGLTLKEIDAKYQDIVNFADIGDFIDQPIKSYSSGMVVRLAFAVVAHVDADVLIVDEALAVGDAFFTQKCMRFLRRFMETNTVLFVSHDVAAVNSMCNKAILLENGAMKMAGAPKEVTEQYLTDLYESVQGESALPHAEPETGGESRDPLLAAGRFDYQDMRQNFVNGSTLRNDIEVFRFQEDATAFGKGGASIVQVLLLDDNNAPLHWIVGGERVTLSVYCRAHEYLASPIIGFHLKDRLGQAIFGDNTFLVYRDTPLSVRAGQTFNARFTFRMPLLEVGDYSIGVAIADGTQNEHVQHQWMHDAVMLRSNTTCCVGGIVGIPMLDVRLGLVEAETTSASPERADKRTA